mgnify:CR=1 FL=1
MKKLISMMLMLCAVITFSACSSDDDGPSNPVSNPTVPQSAKIGAEVTIQGTGFAEGQTLWLVPEYGEAVNVNAKMATSGAKFTVPYTLNEGKVDVVLQVENNKWTLGSMTLLAAENPITAISVPSGLALGKEVTIAGIGFAEGDKIVLIPVANTTKSYMIDKTPQGTTVVPTVAADGVKFTVLVDLAEGEYTVFLVRGNSTWALGTTAVYVDRRIESITISDNDMLTMYAPMLGLEDGKLVVTFDYNENGSLKAISSNGTVGWAFEYNGKTITTTNSYSQPLAYTIDDQGRIISSTGYDMYGEEVAYTWSYDANGYLESVKQVGAADDADVNLLNTYTDGNLSAYTMSMVNELTTDKSIRTCPNTVEPLYLLNGFSLMQTREDLFLGFLLNRNVKVSTYVPNQLIATDIDYSTGGETKNTVAIEKSFENNCLTLKTTGGAISQAQAMLSNTVVVKYQNK